MTLTLQSIRTAHLHLVRAAQAVIASCFLIMIATTFASAASPQWSQYRPAALVRSSGAGTQPHQTLAALRHRSGTLRFSAPENFVVEPSKLAAPQSKLGQLAAREMRKEQSQSQSGGENKATAGFGGKAGRRSSPRSGGSNRWAKTRRRNSKRGTNPRISPSPIPPAEQKATELDVTFVADVPKVEIKLNSNGQGTRFLGATGEDGKLIAKVKPGLYVATLSHPGYFILNRQIEVRSDQTTHPFKLEAGRVSPTVPAVTLTPALTPEPAITLEPVSNIKTVTAESILERYLDPKQTDGVAGDDWQKVLSLTNEALSQNANNSALKARALFAQGQIAYLGAKYSDALLAFTDAAQALPKSALPFLGRGNTYLALRQYGEAVKEYEQAHKIYSLEANKDLAVAHRGMADALSAQSKTVEAIKHYQQAKSFGYFSPEMAANMARALMKQRRWRQALDELAEASKLKQTADMMILTGDCYDQLKQTQEAGQSYLTATELDNKSASAFFKLGGELLEQRKYQEAKQALDRAVALDPTSVKIDSARARKMIGDAEKKLARS